MKTCRVDVRIFDIERMAAWAAAAAGDDGGVLLHSAAAIATYRGELLPGVYEDWLLDARSQLERQCVDLCDLVGAVRARAGDLAGAVEAARRRVQLQPLEEAGYRTLMELQADLGDRAGAVSTYHHCASVLERELGVAPDPSTRQVFRRLMAHARPAAQSPAAQSPAAQSPAAQSPAAQSPAAQSPAAQSPAAQSPAARPPAAQPLAAQPLATQPPAVQPPAAADPGVHRPGLAAAQLFGRSAELGVLQDAWRAAVAGGRGLALVRGGAGVGKTRLVAEVAEMARSHGAVVAIARCFGTAGRLALAPVADWLRHDAVQSAAATLDPAWRAEVGRLIPAEADADRRTSSRVMADAWQRHRFFEGLARALIAVHRPLLLVLDNMQWCDQETLAFVTFCLGLADDAQLLVAATVREDNLDEDAELAGWIVRMRATGLLTEVSLTPLEAADTAHLAEAVSGQRFPEADADLLQAATGGFPLYVIEAVRGTARHAAAGRRSRHGAAQASRTGDCGSAGGGRPRGGGRRELHPRSAYRGIRPGRRPGCGGSRRAMAAQDRSGIPGWLRLLPRPAARNRICGDQPAETLAAAPAHRPGPGIAPRRGHRQRRGPARRAIRPGRAAGAGDGLLPAGSRSRGRHVRSYGGHPAAREGAVDRGRPA